MRKYIDKHLFIILLGYVAAYHIIYISKRVLLKLLGEPGYLDMDWWATVLGPIFCNFIIMPPIILLILFVTKRMIDLNLNWVSSLGLHFIFSIFYFFLVISFNTIYNNVIYGDALELFSREALINILYGSTLNFLGYVGFVTIIYAYYYIQKISNSEIQKAQLSEQLQNVKMQALKSQLNPHFLFNTLNSISSLIEMDRHKAQHMIGNLGGLLREILVVKDENLVRVRKEMIILNKYIDIMQTRFSDHLLVEIFIEDQVFAAMMPSMLLQPILENSFEHGYSNKSTKLRVNLSISKNGRWLLIVIKNNGAPLAAKNNNNGVGIRNIKERLQALFGNNYNFSFSNLENGAGVQTNIEIPYILA